MTVTLPPANATIPRILSFMDASVTDARVERRWEGAPNRH
jgi:hypothetical protein